MFAACLCSTATFAQDEADADTREVLAYTLSEAGLAKYSQATRNLAALDDGMPGACEEDTGEASIDEMVASLDAWPGASGAIRAAGMTTREYIVFSWSLVHNGLAAWSASQPGGSLPPGVSRANADFVMQHEAELQQIGASASGDDCEDTYDDEEYDEAIEE
ncbi:MAG: hypothetical protein OEW64_11900 [Gammaproteobacteria bacterium]|nr:hypothetical protein [Gammaproteobacteria bacterium]